MPKCFICDKEYESGRELTCSDQCHEDLARRLITRFGEFKKVVRASTGITYKVPTRDIIEKGIREQDLDRYPIWNEEERKGLICRPVSLGGYILPGALPDKCSKCGQAVWVSPSSWLIIHDNPDMEIVCEPCAIVEIKKEEQIKIEAITPAQAEEIEEYLGSSWIL